MKLYRLSEDKGGTIAWPDTGRKSLPCPEMAGQYWFTPVGATIYMPWAKRFIAWAGMSEMRFEVLTADLTEEELRQVAIYRDRYQVVI